MARPGLSLLALLVAPLHAAGLARHWRPAAAAATPALCGRRRARPAVAVVPFAKGDVLLVPFFESLKGGTPPLDATLVGLDAALGGGLSDLLRSQQFTGALGSSATAVLPAGAPFGKLSAIGLGRPTAFRSLGAMHLAWGELIARYTRAEACQLAVAVCPRIEGGLEQPLGVDDSGAVFAAAAESGQLTRMDAAVAAAVAAKPLPSLPAAKVSPFEAVTRVASMFARSGSSAAGPNVAQQAEAARQAAKRAALRGDASMARAVAALARSEFEAAAESVADARAAFQEAGGEVEASREVVLAGLDRVIAEEAERDQQLALALSGKDGGFEPADRPEVKAVTWVVGYLVTRRPVCEGGEECAMPPDSLEGIAGAFAAQFVGVDIEVQMLDRDGYVAEPLYGGQVDLEARRDGYMYDESTRSYSGAPPTPTPTPTPTRTATEPGGGPVELRGDPGGVGDLVGDVAGDVVGDRGDLVLGDPAELIQPTDDFDVLVLQFQKAERQEADEPQERDAAEGAAPAAEATLTGDLTGFDAGAVVVE